MMSRQLKMALGLTNQAYLMLTQSHMVSGPPLKFAQVALAVLNCRQALDLT